jgi:ribosomal protein S18 acetylase RimI-like enzyme
VAPPVTIRPAAETDLPVLDRSIPTGANDVHRAFLRRQATGDATYLVAWRGAEPVGSGVIRWAGRSPSPDPEISNLYVPESLQGGGIGTAIVRFAEELIRGRGFGRVSIGVDVSNARAAALYQRLGYRDTGRRWTASYTYFDRDGVEQSETEHVRVLVLEV